MAWNDGDSGLLDKISSMRLHLQDGGDVASEDVYAVVEVLKSFNVLEDCTQRRSLVLVLETLCRRIWQWTKLLIHHVDESCCVLMDVVRQRIGMHLDEIQFQDRDRWFGGVTPSVRRSPDKARIFSIITVCMALLQKEKGAMPSDQKVILDKMTTLYASNRRLANDLLNSDDRFLTTVSALLTIKTELEISYPHRVILAAFREIRFDSKTVLAWIDNDELGFETILMIVESLIEDRKVWEAVAKPKSTNPPFAKRSRLYLNNDDDDDDGIYRTTYLYEEPYPSDDDVLITIRIPYLEDSEECQQKTLSFSKRPEIKTCYRLDDPKPDDSDFDALVEMFVEVKLILNMRLLDTENNSKDVTRLRNALAQFLDEDSNEDDGQEYLDEVDEEEGDGDC